MQGDVIERKQKMNERLMQQILGIVIPEEKLKDFEIEKIEETEEQRVFHIVEKESRKQETGEELIKDGMSPKNRYPSRLEQCFCHYRRQASPPYGLPSTEE